MFQKVIFNDLAIRIRMNKKKCLKVIMKFWDKKLVIVCIVSVVCIMSCFEIKAQIIDLSLSQWQFRKANEGQWLPATVPGTVHTDLLANKKIEEPYYRTNEKDLQWIEAADWEYKTTLVVDEKIVKEEKVELVFEGLDTYADVYLNDHKVITANNMFLLWKADVKKWMHTGHNQLRIYFHSPINKVMPQYDSLGYTVPVSNNDQADKRVSVYSRKAGYHYGWDWGPRFVTSGVWRPVYLKAWSSIAIEDLFIKQLVIKGNDAQIEAQIAINSTGNETKIIQIFVEGNSKPLVSEPVLLITGSSTVTKRFQLHNIERWWPNGMGKQKLYHFTVKFLNNQNQTIATKSVQKGFREIEVVQESGTKGQSFYFKINGKPFFAKGANYIPQDNFLPRVTKERYEHIIQTAVESNMNMLRVWGGGIYENDLFYELCDEKGIFVWQDFMFACALYPPLPALKQSIYDEAVYNVKRLRNHPAIALWCGNNEIVQFMNENYWGHMVSNWRTNLDSLTTQQTYQEIFHQILPAALKAKDDEKFYWSSSPNGKNYDAFFTNNKQSGDGHYWGVWWGKEPFEHYSKNISPFMSEYGFQSFPELATVQEYALPDDYNIESTVMKSHQRSTIGNGTIAYYMQDMFKVPTGFEDFLYVGQVLQAEGIRMAIESHRRAKPFCMGSLYWQIDDCWPVASWSSMDYYGRWKALQYAAKKAYAPQLISIFKDESNKVNVHIVSDEYATIKGKLTIKLLDFNGKELQKMEKEIMLPPNSSAIYYTLPENQWLQGVDTNAIFLAATFIDANTQNTTNNQYFFTKPKHQLLTKPNIRIHQLDASHIELSTDKLARFVCLHLPNVINAFEDNYFDLLPNTKKIVKLRQPLGTSGIEDIKIQTLFNAH